MDKKVEQQIQMIWTISGRYDIKPRTLLYEELRNEKLCDLRLIVVGGIYRYIPVQYIDDYLLRIVGLGESTKYFLELFLCLAEEYVIPKLAKHRRFLPVIENNTSREIYRCLSNIPIKSEKDKLTGAYYTYKSGKDYSMYKTDAEIVNSIKRVRDVRNATEFMKFLYQIFDMYLGGIPKKYVPKSNTSDDEQYALNSEVLKKSESNIFDEEHEDAEVFSAEFSHNALDDEVDIQLEAVDELLLFASHADSKVMFDKIISNYGPSKLTDRQRIELEREVSKDNHKGCKIHYVDEFMDKAKGYKRDYMAEQYDSNIRHYDEYRGQYENAIKHLISIIKEKILTDLEDTHYNLDRGIPDRTKLYRYVAIKDNKIFKKTFKDTVGTIALTILIDASGSQLARQKQIASWGYILSQAFTLCGIPTRVVGFNNLFDYTVFREYRDFYDTASKNKDIFYFTPEGSNRDGMAIRTMSYLMRYKQEDKKLLLVLSDGKPNDVRIGVSTHMVSGHDTSEYTGIKAVEDTASIVRKSRSDGIDVVGVYTGERDDIATQKLIYGKDFAYVPDLSQMGKVVGMVIEKAIKK